FFYLAIKHSGLSPKDIQRPPDNDSLKREVKRNGDMANFDVLQGIRDLLDLRDE
ncbi:unnamed protein product, partial [Durusdinium trenchii]